jgi:hypothetical protein
MDEHPFRVLSRKEFDGLSLDEKLAYLDLDLISAVYGRGVRKESRRATPSDTSLRRKAAERRISGP